MEGQKYRKTVQALLASVASGAIIGVCFYWARQSFGWQFYWGSETHELRVLNALQIGLVSGVALLLNGQQQTGPERRVKAQEHRHDIVMPVKPARVPQSVEQEIAPKGIKQAHQHQHDLQGALTLHTVLRFV
jgi:hypothetical protein